ncbi:MAG: hypothetical protein WBM17_09585 [Anaerolineales bacterium]
MTNYKPATILILTLLTAAACTKPPAPATGKSYPLATATENFVTVAISLDRDAAGQAWLSAAFVPTESQFSLYSKDLPREGVNGLGRPTLLELVPGSRLRAMGSLSESVASKQGDGPAGLLLYPPGPVILRLPVGLPEESWFEDQVSVTYMACSGGVCKFPVEGKRMPIRVPGNKFS